MFEKLSIDEKDELAQKFLRALTQEWMNLHNEGDNKSAEALRSYIAHSSMESKARFLLLVFGFEDEALSKVETPEERLNRLMHLLA